MVPHACGTHLSARGFDVRMRTRTLHIFSDILSAKYNKKFVDLIPKGHPAQTSTEQINTFSDGLHNASDCHLSLYNKLILVSAIYDKLIYTSREPILISDLVYIPKRRLVESFGGKDA